MCCCWLEQLESKRPEPVLRPEPEPEPEPKLEKPEESKGEHEKEWIKVEFPNLEPPFCLFLLFLYEDQFAKS